LKMVRYEKEVITTFICTVLACKMFPSDNSIFCFQRAVFFSPLRPLVPSFGAGL